MNRLSRLGINRGGDREHRTGGVVVPNGPRGSGLGKACREMVPGLTKLRDVAGWPTGRMTATLKRMFAKERLLTC